MTDGPVPLITIDLIDPDAMALWRTVARVAATLGDDRRWCLVGGLMVSLFAIEASESQRATTDVGATLLEIPGQESDRGFRFVVDGQVVDVLAPDGLGPDGATTAGKMKPFQIPGGTQALSRSEVVEIVIDGESFRLRRPRLIGAILLKARSLRVHARTEDQRYDLVTLLGLLDDPRAARSEMSAKEAGWLRSIDERLEISDPNFETTFDAPRLRAARAAYRILVA